MQIPEEFKGSKALSYIIQKGWSWKQSDKERAELEQCPICRKNGFGHFYIICDGDTQDGLWMCHHCGKSSNLRTLMEQTGGAIASVESVGNKSSKQEEMPDYRPMHEALLADSDALLYLLGRGWTKETIKKQRLGLTERKFRKQGVTKALVYPYLVGENCTFMHFRTLPPKDKEFSSLGGWDAPLYNEGALRDGTKEILFVEGEPDTITLLQAGIEGVCGVPGASLKKAMWISRLDELEIERVYICYDNDKAGRRGGQDLASRIGINRCYRVDLPKFKVPDGQGGEKDGKDINDWFLYGNGTKDKFLELITSAPKFDVSGVTGVVEGLEELRDRIQGKGLMPKYDFPWQPLSKLIGVDEGDVIDITAPEKIGKTTFALNCLEYWVDKYQEDGLFICMEMTNIQMLKKWVSHVAHVENKITLDPEEAKILNEKFLDGIAVALEKHNHREGNLYFCYPTGISAPEDMYNLIVDCIRRYGVKWVVIDNIHLLAGKTLKGEGKAIHLDKISKNTQSIAKEYNVQIVRILQPHRIGGDGVCTTDNIEGSSQIAKDCDGSLVLNRARQTNTTKASLASETEVLEETSTFMRKLVVSVGLSRYSAGGETTLDYDGAYSTIGLYDWVKNKQLSMQEKFAKVTGEQTGKNQGQTAASEV
jgi:hypothetical protein